MDEDWGFARAADLARTADESFALAQIAAIEAAWVSADLDRGAFGFVLSMTNGQRLYWRYTSGDPEAGRAEDLAVTELTEGQIPPSDDDARWYKPDRLNAQLAVLRRFT
ncbi:MAG: hypothetical protein JOY64_27390 [Alphaproteobacteria bacterium]|nr:hypothetical protein [Alphaproteobacteria bacterium]MBV8411381.1 hypothetical protein [Alphaproteobacteria bacterium]